MTITPQLIKDQEFQVKFRGCDPLEVRDYLETIADEFFELQEQCKEYLEELETLREEKESAANYTGSLETDMKFTRKISDELKDSCSQKEEKLEELTQEVEELNLRIADLEQEDTEHDEEVSTVAARIEEVEDALKVSETEKESLRNKIEVLEEQNAELKKDEVDFKSTLVAAQHFSEDLKEKSKTQAEDLVAEANTEIAAIREAARGELERLPREIEALEKKKGEVKADLKATLFSCLDSIEGILSRAEKSGEQIPLSETAGNDELFQTIEINDDGSLNPEDVGKLNDGSTPHGSSDAIDDKVLDSLLRGDKSGAKDDDFDLENMFDLETSEKGKKPSPSSV